MVLSYTAVSPAASGPQEGWEGSGSIWTMPMAVKVYPSPALTWLFGLPH
jgi:hypothetical protein